jgi:alanyl-tRNA synthetase
MFNLTLSEGGGQAGDKGILLANETIGISDTKKKIT